MQPECGRDDAAGSAFDRETPSLSSEDARVGFIPLHCLAASMSAGKKQTHRGMQMSNWHSLQSNTALIAERRHVCSQREQRPGGTDLKAAAAGPRSEECFVIPASHSCQREGRNFPGPRIIPWNKWQKAAAVEQRFSHLAEGNGSCWTWFCSVTCGPLFFLMLFFFFFLTVCFTVPLTVNRSVAPAWQCSPRLQLPPLSSCCKCSA